MYDELARLSELILGQPTAVKNLGSVILFVIGVYEIPRRFSGDTGGEGPPRPRMGGPVEVLVWVIVAAVVLLVIIASVYAVVSVWQDVLN